MSEWSEHIILSLKPFNKCFQKAWFFNTVFFIKSFIYDKIYVYLGWCLDVF